MMRTITAFGVLVALASTASAQPRALPLSPGVMPASPFGPGMPFPAAPIPQRAGAAGKVFFPVALPTGWGVGWGYRTYNPWTGFGYNYGGLVPAFPPPAQPVIVEPPAKSEPTVITLAREFPATLTVQLPAAAEIWLDGKKVTDEASAVQVLKSPVLKPNQKYTFDVKARWTTDGKTYEAERAVTLGAGQRSRLFIVSGDEVKE